MVYALEKIHRLLEPHGFLIDIHPSGEPPPVEVRVGDRYFLAGWLKEADEYIEYVHAQEALQVVLDRGLFAVDESDTFTFNTYADSLEDMQSHWAEVWEDAYLEDQVIGRIEDLWRSPSKDKELVIREIVSISRMRPLKVSAENL